MNSRDGHSKKDRLDRLLVPGNFKMLDNDKGAMLQKLIQISKWIRFHSEEKIDKNGVIIKEHLYFEDVLEQLIDLHTNIRKKHALEINGEMEPSQALLLAFIENLLKVSEQYNDRWRNFSQWYLEEHLRIKPLTVIGDQVWMAFDKIAPGKITIEKNTGFNRKNGDLEVLTYRLEDDLVVQDISIEHIRTVYFEKNQKHYPAAKLDFVTAIKTRDLLNDNRAIKRTLLFDHERHSNEMRSIGIRISSPSLLLREGKRKVDICFESENIEWLKIFISARNKLQRNINASKTLKEDIYKNLFYITISTPTGWTQVTIYDLDFKKELNQTEEHKRANQFTVKMLIPEDFPSTVGCSQEIHNFESEFPAIRIRLNFDAWLHAYSWIHKFSIQRILIRTEVLGINDVQVYNELGKIDNSKSFPPFGIKTTAGVWMAIGNYEMAIKNVTKINVSLKWNQLPLHPRGLKGHYAAYGGNIQNNSFRIRTRYLSDNNWFPTLGKNNFSLFRDAQPSESISTKSDNAVSSESFFNQIIVKKMLPFEGSEEEYKYTIKTRTGFVRLTLEKPDMGFGNEEYRNLFTERMMMKKWRKKRLPVLHPPIFPHVENIILDYIAEDVIDLRKNTRNSNVIVDQLHPFGVVSSRDTSTNTGIPFVFSLETPASLMLGLKNVKGGETFSTYMVLEATSNEMNPREDYPQINMYWGDGYYWEEIPRGFIEKDETKSLTISGNLVYNFPDHISAHLYDKNGILWIRAGFVKNHQFVPEIKRIYSNAGLAVLDTSETSVEKMQSFKNSHAVLEPEKKLPGITSINQITSYYSGQEMEDLKSMQARVSEYVTHRGRAVTPRDFELLTLQKFPDIGKVLCLPNTNLKNGTQGAVTVVVIPQYELKTMDNSKPMVPSGALTRIEDFLSSRASQNAWVDVINPVYEELQIKCIIRLSDDRQLVPLESLFEICDNFIAPWQKNGTLPKFGQSIPLSQIYNAIQDADFVKEIIYFAVIHVSQSKSEDQIIYHLDTHENQNEILVPDQMHKLFVPAETHLIQVEKTQKTVCAVGIGDLEIGETFIIPTPQKKLTYGNKK